MENCSQIASKGTSVRLEDAWILQMTRGAGEARSCSMLPGSMVRTRWSRCVFRSGRNATIGVAWYTSAPVFSHDAWFVTKHSLRISSFPQNQSDANE